MTVGTTPAEPNQIGQPSLPGTSSICGRFRRGEMPLARTFWLGWALPVMGGNLLLAAADAGWFGDEIDIRAYYGFTLAVALYAIFAAMPVWRSATAYAGPGVWRLGACAAALTALAINLFGVVSVAGLLTGIGAGDETAEELNPTCGEGAERLET